MRAKPGAIPDDHETECDCAKCAADKYLTPEDWDVLDFYRIVSDQVVNLVGFGDAYLVPRLEAWEAAYRIFRPGEELDPVTIAHARALFYAVEGRLREPEAFWATPQSLAPDDPE